MSDNNNPTEASNNNNSNNNNSTKNNNGKSEGWIVQTISLITVGYLLLSLTLPTFWKQGEKLRKIETPDVLVIALALLFNSGLTKRLIDLEISKEGSLKANFKKLENLEKQVDSLSESIDELLLTTVLDAFEYVTLNDLQEERDRKYKINPSGYALLERLRNRGLIEDKKNVLDDPKSREIQLKESVSITDLGRKYLKLVNNKENIRKELMKVWDKYGYSHSREVRSQQ